MTLKIQGRHYSSGKLIELEVAEGKIARCEPLVEHVVEHVATPIELAESQAEATASGAKVNQANTAVSETKVSQANTTLSEAKASARKADTTITGAGTDVNKAVAHESLAAHEAIADGQTTTSSSRLFIAPGLIDLQINGYLGDDFNQLPLNGQTIISFCQHMWRLGVVKCYPTLITNSFAALREALQVIAETCERYPLVNATIAGIHLEGPFISPLDGARGAHDKQYVCPPNIAWLEAWQAASGNRIKIITLSPEWEGSEAFIAYCKQHGIIASIGHTAATPEQIARAVVAGASMVTHFGNGVQLQLPRHPNYLWEQLAQEELYACVIADGYHLPQQVLKVVHKVKGKRMVLVSDAVALAGSPAGRYTTFIGGEVVLTPAGKLHLAHNEQLLAGSASTLIDGIYHMQQAGITSIDEAWDMASCYPAVLSGLANQSGLAAGAPADFAVYELDDAGKPNIRETYISGQRVY